ncbi:hypothetical protein DFH07DRAFT_1057681 [Mycena maculata]|uniref:F-box domain-containing protein n=1 Tax=Mycena maculata TaxID=230809 RepID=A0AAD7NQC0_9AGAR|nr:hypothetical protein DFH07DRAFT_1057681 [Mycena maculata]
MVALVNRGLRKLDSELDFVTASADTYLIHSQPPTARTLCWLQVLSGRWLFSSRRMRVKVIASAGTEEKLQFVKVTGVNVSFNYKTPDTREKEGPIDVYIFYETLNGAEQSLNRLNRDSAQTLAGLARTCTAFRDPALNLLWKSQCTVMNVLNCMPGDIWEVLDDADAEEVRLKRPVLPSDWERPLIYSHRVRHFKYKLSYSYPDSAAFYEMLRMCLPPEPLFPNIESLLWETSDAALLPHFRQFIGPSLTSLTVSTFQSASHLSLLPALAAQCPLLQEVCILTSDGLPGRCETVSFLVKQLTRLESLEAPCLDAVALDHLARRPVLDFVHLDDQTPLSPVLEFASQTEVSSSCDIAMLTLTVTDARAATEVLARTRPQPPCGRSTTALLRIATTRPSTLSRSRYHPRDTTETAADPEQIALYAVPGTHLFPLFTLTTLTSVTLAGPVGLDLDDAAAAEIARAWPRITSLDIAGSAFLHISPRTTLRALLAFARLCPHLWRLSLPINARSVPKWRKAQTAAEERPTQRCLRSLHVGESPVGTPLDVAAYLSSIFPRLEWVSAGKEDSRDVRAEVLAGQRKWKAVEAALPVLRKVRVEEKYWTRREYEDEDSD